MIKLRIVATAWQGTKMAWAGLRLVRDPSQLGVVFDESQDRMIVRADELALDEDADDDVTLGMARFALTRGQVQAFVVQATLLLSSGRPTCPLCARPIDPEGHMCIKTNGHKKH